jgi:hypothetical protein
MFLPLRFPKYVHLKVLPLLFTLIFFNCSPDDDIKVTSERYTQGGVGTSYNKGAVLFTFDIPSYYSIGYVRITLNDQNYPTRTINGIGRKQIRFSYIDPAHMSYTIEFWTHSNRRNLGFRFVNGNLVNISGGFVNYHNVLTRSKSISKSVIVKSNKTVTINVDLD